jgi:hypothetical protein
VQRVLTFVVAMTIILILAGLVLMAIARGEGDERSDRGGEGA